MVEFWKALYYSADPRHRVATEVEVKKLELNEPTTAAGRQPSGEQILSETERKLRDNSRGSSQLI